MTLPTIPSQRSDPPGGLSIATATALLNSSMAKIARPGAQLALPTPQLPEPILSVPPSLTPAHTSPPRSAIAASPMLSANNSSDSDSSEDSPSSSYEPQTSSALWSQKEADLFIKSARRRGNDYPAILADLEAAGHYGRTAGAVKTRYNRLRREGVFHDVTVPASTTSRTISQEELSTPASVSPSVSRPHCSASQTRSRAPGRQKSKSPRRNYHRWTDEEKRVVLRIGGKHHKAGTPRMMAAMHKEWKQHFPKSRLNEHAVLAYYHLLRRKGLGEGSEEDRDGEEEEDADSVSEAESVSSSQSAAPVLAGPSLITTSRAPRGAAAASSSSKQAGSLSGFPDRSRVRRSEHWHEDELEALVKVHRALATQNVGWPGPKAVYRAYCKLMPRTKRSQNAVGKKYLRLYADSIRERDSSSSGSESSEEDSDEDLQHGDSTMLTEADLYDVPREARAGRVRATTTALARPSLSGFDAKTKRSTAQKPLNEGQPFTSQPPASTTVHSFHQSFPPASRNTTPALKVLATILPDGFLFENCVGFGIAIYSPASFKVLTPQQTAALAQLPEEEQPAFAFIVGEGGEVQTVIAPQGTTRGVRMIRDGVELRGEQGERGAERAGVEAFLSGADGYKISVVTWL